MKKRLVTMAIALAAALCLLVLSAVLGSGDERRLQGSWIWNADLGDVLARRLEGTGDASARYFDLSRFDVAVQFDFQPDGTYSVQVDRPSFDAAMDVFMEDAAQGMTRYLGDLAAQSGMTLDDVLSATGMTVDDLMGTLRQQLSEDLALSRTPVRGRYRVEEKELLLSLDPDAEPDPDLFAAFAFRGGHQLRFAESPGASALLEQLAGLGGAPLFPMVLIR